MAKAFVALQRGQDPFAALTREEREEIRGASTPYRIADIRGAHRLRERPELIGLAGVITALGGFGLDQLWLVGVGLAGAATGFALQAWLRLRANRLARALAAALAAGERPRVFEELERLLRETARSDWVALVKWQEDGLGGEIEVASGEGPPEIALMSWLVREAESRDDLLVTAAHELGGDGAYVALPLRRENSALTGFLVLRSPVRSSVTSPPRSTPPWTRSGSRWHRSSPRKHRRSYRAQRRAELGDPARLEQAQPLETGADLCDLVLARLDERQPHAADVVTEQVQRGLDLDRPGDDADQLVGGRKLVVQLPCRLDVARAEALDQLLDLRADDVGVHADAAEPAELDEGQHEVVVARVEVEPELDDVPGLVEVGVGLLDRLDVGICASSVIVSGSMLITQRPGML